jgi:23S rRNA pseudouridine2604 synthase
MEQENKRLNKFLSEAGVCSRRAADKLIEDGKVTVNGLSADLGTKITAKDIVVFQGRRIESKDAMVLIAVNKPVGIVCTTEKREKDNVVDYLKYPVRIFPIGRLDKDSQGLLLMTNNGDIVNKILRAGNFHEKEYIVTLDKDVKDSFILGMSKGVPILETVTRPCVVEKIGKRKIRIILTQGLNRQIRRMCEYFDYRVVALKRVRIMNIELGNLKVGHYRDLTKEEMTDLYDAIRDSHSEHIQR